MCERNHLQIADVVAERDIFIQVAAADALALTGQTFFVRIRGLGMAEVVTVRVPVGLP